MHQLARYCAGWVSATALATGVSWVAIENLVTTAALGRPLAVSAPAPARPAAAPATPTIAVTTPGPRVTRVARPEDSATSSAPPRRRPATSTSPAVPTVSPSAPVASSAPEVAAKGYPMKGGQVVLDLRADSAKLVSAVPAAGYETETWRTEYWLRVDFVSGDRRSSLIVSWYQHAPTVQVTET